MGGFYLFFFGGRCFRDVRAGTAYSAGSVALTAADRPIDAHTDVVAKYGSPVGRKNVARCTVIRKL
jgi:hypothetical protein